jgi:hypothetical protein
MGRIVPAPAVGASERWNRWPGKAVVRRRTGCYKKPDMRHSSGSMMAWRLFLAVPGVLAAACALPPRGPEVAVPVAREASRPADDAPQSAPPAPAAPADERGLRHAFAAASDGTEVAGAALRLVSLLRDEERLPEALAVLEAGIRRDGGLPLRVERAGLLRDLGQRHAALAELRALRDEGQVLSVPQQLELAELAWLEGEHAAAAATVSAVLADAAGAAWLAQADAMTRQMVADVSAGRGVQFLRIRDLLGNLRGAPLPSDRSAALEVLLDPARLPADLALEAAERALAIALRDGSPAVRAHAIRLAPAANGLAADAAAVGLADPQPIVRAEAARAAAAAPGADTVGDLLAALRIEEDGAAFGAIQAALARLLPGLPRLPAAAAEDAAARAAVRAAVAGHLQPTAEEAR